MALSRCVMHEDPSLTDGMCYIMCIVCCISLLQLLFVWEAIHCLMLFACLNVNCAQLLLSLCEWCVWGSVLAQQCSAHVKLCVRGDMAVM